MQDWNGKEIAFAHSKGGGQIVAHPMDNLISTGCLPWPPAEIVQKLYRSRQENAFTGEQLAICKSGLGYYCDLQSLNSEDAITWSVFGTIARSDRNHREAWVADFLRLIDIPKEVSPICADICLWRRIPHPDTLVSGGPEIDFEIITENAVILGEAKWKSSVGKAQGKLKDKDQIQLRGEWLEKHGNKVFPQCKHHVVLGVSLVENSFENSVPDGVIFKSAVWEEVCKLSSHPLCEEVARYFNWKVQNSISNR
jgi:hypothetical protein